MTAPERRIRILPDAGAVARAAALEFERHAGEAVRERGRFVVALSGGSTPRALYRFLSEGDGAEAPSLPWERIHLFWGDERLVPKDHPESNYRMVRESLLEKAPIPPANVHPIETGEGRFPGKVAAAYERELIEFFRPAAGEAPRFDLILLGMGADGHTASLFPGSAVLRETARLVAAPWVEKLGAHRITLTPPVLNHALAILFLVAGSDKAPALLRALEGDDQPDRLPARIVHPVAGSILWLVDAEASQLLTRTSRGGPPGP